MTPSSSLHDDPAPGGGQPPRRRWRLAIFAGLWLAVAAAAGGYVWLRSARRVLPPASSGQAQIGGPFSLIDPAGRPVTDRDFRGRFMLVYFGYTHCPDVCPTTLGKVAAALPLLGPAADKVQPIFVTVDPEHDTPGVMGRYAGQFSPRILGLTGSPAQIAQAEKAYRVYAALQRTGPGQAAYMMNHTSILYLMGPDGQFVAPVRADGGAPQVAADIARYVGQ
jgi:protein SCO1/2